MSLFVSYLNDTRYTYAYSLIMSWGGGGRVELACMVERTNFGNNFYILGHIIVKINI